MAHRIDNSKGFNAFVSYRAAAWHGLGKVFHTAIDSKTALRESGADFEVIKAPNVHRFNGIEIVSEESFFTYRTDVNKVLGSKLGCDYTVLQNFEAFDLVDEILGAGTASIETAGVIDEGRKVFICLKVNQSIIVSPDDKINQYILLANSHDGSMSITAMPTNIRVVCNNTLSAALRASSKSAGKITLRHTTNAKSRLTEAAKVLKLISDNTAVNAQVYGEMKENIINPNQLMDYVGNVFCSPEEIKAMQDGKKLAEAVSTRKLNIVKDVLYYANKGIGQAEALNGSNLNMWFAYNAVTGYMNDRKYKSADDRANSMLFGTVANTIQNAGILAAKPELVKPLHKIASSGFNLN